MKILHLCLVAPQPHPFHMCVVSQGRDPEKNQVNRKAKTLRFLACNLFRCLFTPQQ